MSSIVTRTGDDGSTGLYGGGRVPKDAARMHAIGTIDELNASIGMVLGYPVVGGTLREQLQRLQHLLFRVGADLATPSDAISSAKRVQDCHVNELEQWIHAMESMLPEQQTFIVPGGTPTAAHVHLARTVCRRAERCIASLQSVEGGCTTILKFVNRLSDYLFIAARTVNMEQGVPDTPVVYDDR
jgi:cob(I)alamin adenosyltransferase